jgi:outer membrane receptor protein involved in Fe transport
VPVSYTNFGTVDTRGVEVGLTHVLTSKWRLDGALNWFDFDIKEQAPGFPDLLLPNAPPWQLALGVRYSDARWLAAFRGRWVDRFRWSTGIFIGDVESYSTVELDAQYRVAPDWTVGVSATNLLNDVHYEFFGAPLLRRWTRVYVTFSR